MYIFPVRFLIMLLNVFVNIDYCMFSATAHGSSKERDCKVAICDRGPG